MRTITRLFAVISLVAICNAQPICAQYAYQAEVHPSTPLLSPKPMMSALVQSIEVTNVSHDHGTRALLFTSPTTVSLLQLRTLIEPHGYAVVRFNATRETADDVRSNDPADDLFPAKTDLGNEIEDNARYDTAKSLWIQAHQLEYDAMTNGERPVLKESYK